MVKISIIIINYNGGDLTRRCLAALERQTMQDFEVILVDNASTDGSFEKLKHAIPSWLTTRVDEPEFRQPDDRALVTPRIPLKLLPLTTNTGFAGGNNAGAKLAAGEYLVLLNNDAFPDPDWLEALITAAEQHRNFDFFTSRQYCYHEPHLLDGTGDMLASNGRAWRRDYRALATQGTQTPGEVFAGCGAAVMYRKKDFDAVGGFDEDFFCHFEDVDLSFRLRLIGNRCLYVPSAIVYHIGSATVGGEQSSFALYQGLRNSVWCYIKCMPSSLLWKNLPRFLARNLLDVFHQTLTGNGRIACKAKWHALKRLPAVLKKRRAIQSAAQVQASEIARLVLTDPGHPVCENTTEETLPEPAHGR